MKQVTHLAVTPILSSHGQQRRQMGRFALGAAAALGLAACGGGDGGEESSDPKDLRAALDRLEAGMTLPEVWEAVGWEPNDSDRDWSHNGQTLQVSLWIDRRYSEELVIETARWTTAGEGINRLYPS